MKDKLLKELSKRKYELAIDKFKKSNNTIGFLVYDARLKEVQRINFYDCGEIDDLLGMQMKLQLRSRFDFDAEFYYFNFTNHDLLFTEDLIKALFKLYPHYFIKV